MSFFKRLWRGSGSVAEDRSSMQLNRHDSRPSFELKPMTNKPASHYIFDEDSEDLEQQQHSDANGLREQLVLQIKTNSKEQSELQRKIEIQLTRDSTTVRQNQTINLNNNSHGGWEDFLKLSKYSQTCNKAFYGVLLLTTLLILMLIYSY